MLTAVVDCCVVGLGRVGLPFAALASHRYRVVGCDLSDRVRALNSEGAEYREPGLEALIARQISSGDLCFREEMPPARVVVICVPTPLGDARAPNLSALFDVVAQTVENLPDDGLLLLCSTVPVGTTDRVAGVVRARRPQASIAYVPERMRPGDALNEMRNNTRLVGGVDDRSSGRAAAFVSAFVQGEVQTTTARMAEFVKLTENASRDVEIALVNTVADTAEALHLDPQEAIRLVNHHPRVSLLSPGIGVGGHCLPVDPWFLVDASPSTTGLLREARAVNDRAVAWATRRIGAAMRRANATRVALLGAAYRPDVDDGRNAPAASIARWAAKRYDTVICDPWVDVPGIRRVPLSEALQREVVVLLVRHAVFEKQNASLAPEQLWLDLSERRA